MTRVLQAQGLSIRAIAQMLNRSPFSVSREFKRNSYSNSTYAAHHADKLYRKRRKNCGRKPKLKSGAAREYVLAKMALRWSPEQIAGRAKRDKVMSSIFRKIPYRISCSKQRISLFRNVIHTFHAEITLRTPVFSCNIPKSCTH